MRTGSTSAAAAAPHVAVVIPAFNEEQTVGAVVQAALTLTPEVIVASDGSGDDTAGAARRAGAQVVELPVNAGKGPALLAALHAGRPGFAALDVFEQEPVYDPTHPLLQLPNVLCTPHLGYAEQRSYAQYLGQAFDNVVRYLDGERGHLLAASA